MRVVLLDDAAHREHMVPPRQRPAPPGSRPLSAPHLHRSPDLLQARRTLKAGGRRSFAWNDYRDLLIPAHQQLDRPLVLRGDNLDVHRDRRLRAFLDAQDWITVHYLPPYAPQLNPVKGIWSLLRRRCQANTAFTDPAHLMLTLRQGLRQIQYGPALVDGCLAGTGLGKESP